MPKLLILSRDKDEYRDLIERGTLPRLELTVDPKEADIVLGEPQLIRDALPLLPGLKWAQSIYAGVEPLVEPTQRHDYVLTNARGVFGELMSEYVFGYLLFLEKKMLDRMKAQEARQWQRPESGVLRSKTIGLLGVGSIGAHLAGTAKHFGMTVRGFTRESEESVQVDEYFHPSPQPSRNGRGSLLEFVTGLDYLVCILPRTKDTDRIVDKNVLSGLPPQAILINVGRGNAVDESALVKALNENRLTAAVLDVFEKEPLSGNSPLWEMDNVIITPHTAGSTEYYDKRVVEEIFIPNLNAYLKGQQPFINLVDYSKGY